MASSDERLTRLGIDPNSSAVEILQQLNALEAGEKKPRKDELGPRRERKRRALESEPPQD